MKFRGRRIILISILVVAIIMACGFFPKLFKSAALEITKSHLIGKTLDSAYPNSVMQNVEADVGTFPVGDGIGVSVTVTFGTVDSIDMVKKWYSLHPEGGMCGIDGGNFPQCGIEVLDNKDGKTTYRIFNGVQMTCEQILDCSEVNETIP